MTNPESSGTTTQWAIRGYIAGLMLASAINAASYFFRSQDFSSLANRSSWNAEAIGFPFIIWQQGQTYGGMFVDYQALGMNFLAGSVIGIVAAIFAVAYRHRLNSMIADFENNANPPRGPVQFSIKSLLISTTLIAIVAASVTQWAGTAELLWFTYLLGPITMLGIAFAPPKISWQKRVVIVSISSLFLIGGAIWTAGVRGVEFDKVLMGIFVCWTPQSAFAAFFLMVWQTIKEGRRTTTAQTDAG